MQRRHQMHHSAAQRLPPLPPPPPEQSLMFVFKTQLQQLPAVRNTMTRVAASKPTFALILCVRGLVCKTLATWAAGEAARCAAAKPSVAASGNGCCPPVVASRRVDSGMGVGAGGGSGRRLGLAAGDDGSTAAAGSWSESSIATAYSSSARTWRDRVEDQIACDGQMLQGCGVARTYSQAARAVLAVGTWQRGAACILGPPMAVVHGLLHAMSKPLRSQTFWCHSLMLVAGRGGGSTEVSASRTSGARPCSASSCAKGRPSNASCSTAVVSKLQPFAPAGFGLRVCIAAGPSLPLKEYKACMIRSEQSRSASWTNGFREVDIPAAIFSTVLSYVHQRSCSAKHGCTSAHVVAQFNFKLVNMHYIRKLLR